MGSKAGLSRGGEESGMPWNSDTWAFLISGFEWWSQHLQKQIFGKQFKNNLTENDAEIGEFAGGGVCFCFPDETSRDGKKYHQSLLSVFSPIFALLCRLHIWVRFPQQGCNFCQAAQKNQSLNCGRSTRSPGRMFTQLTPFWKFALSKSGCTIWTSKVRRQSTWIPFR